MADDDLGLGLSSDDDDLGRSIPPPPVPITASGTSRNVVTTFKPKELREQDKKHGVILKAAADAKRTFLEKERLAVDAAANLDKARDALDELKQQEASILQKIAGVQHSQLLMVQKKREIAKLNEQLQTITDRIQLQMQTMETELQTKYRAEGEKDAAEYELAKLRQRRVAAEEAKESLQVELEAAAEARVAREQKIVAKTQSAHTKRIQETTLAFEAAAAEADRKANDAKRLHAVAVERVSTADKQRRAVRETAVAFAKDKRDKRVESIMSLKSNTEVAVSQLKSANERQAKAAAKKAAQHEAEKEAILADGRNPYEVFRQRDVDADADRQVKSKQDAIAAAKLKLTSAVIKEDELARKDELKHREHAEAVREYQASLSRAVREAKVSDFIAARTKTGEDVLDPTGRSFKIQPSQVTTVKDHGFGLGKSRGDVLEMIASKKQNKTVTIDPRWIPKPVDDEATLRTSPIRIDDGPAGYDDDREIPGGLEPGLSTAATSSGKKFKIRQPSKLEQKIMADARQRQRDHITTTQVVQGKEYKGSGFAAAPSTIDFVDFDVGVPMSKRFVLTNVSLTFNSFKILPLSPAIRDFFEITFTPPGRMSAGLTCPVTIKFTPKTRDDIQDHITVLAQTGPVDIPVNCYSKKAVPVVNTPVIELGKVTMGEIATSNLVLENKGALPVAVTLSAVDFGDEDAPSANDLSAAVSFPSSAMLEAYSKVSLPVKFSPMTEGWLETAIEVAYDHATCRPQQVLAKAQVLPPPVFVEAQTIDVATCVYDKLYRAVVSVRNRGNNALKCLTSVPPALRGVIEFVPDMFFLQAKEKNGEYGKTDVTLKFRPESGMLDRDVVAPFVREDGKVLRVPLTITSPDQVLPVEFELVAKLTSGDVVFEPATLEFGKCYSTQSVSLHLAITNTSDLPQKFGFVNLPTEVRVVTNQGFGTLLPRETVTVQAVYSPSAATELSGSITLQTSMNKSYRIPVTGYGVSSPLKLSHSVIRFGAAVFGETLTSSVYLTNTSASSVSYEWIPPPAGVSNIAVSPLVATLAAGESGRVEITFTPKPADDGTASEEKGIPPHVGSVIVSHSVKPSEPWSSHASWTIPCFIARSGAKSGEVTLNDALALEVHTTTTQTALRLDQTRLAFGQVAVGTTQLSKVRVYNDSKREAALILAGLNPSGAFSFVNAPRTVAPGDYQDILVQFKPLVNKRFIEVPTVSSSHRGAALEFTLTGEGVSPSLALTPADGMIDVGNVVAGDSTAATAKLTNTSAFPLAFSIETIGRSYTNHNGTAVFIVSPQQGRLEAGAVTDIRVTFNPDHVSRSEFVARYKIVVPNQTSDMFLTVKGKSWARQAYVMTASLLDTPADSGALVESSTLVPIDILDGKGSGEVRDGSATPYALSLEFPKLTLEECNTAPAAGPTAGQVTVTKQVILGSCVRGAGKESSPVAFEVTIPPTQASMFGVDVPKGTVPPGGTQKLNFKVTRPKLASADGSSGVLEIGQWTECVVNITFTGGFKCAGVPDKQSVPVTLRAFVVV